MAPLPCFDPKATFGSKLPVWIWGICKATKSNIHNYVQRRLAMVLWSFPAFGCRLASGSILSSLYAHSEVLGD